MIPMMTLLFQCIHSNNRSFTILLVSILLVFASGQVERGGSWRRTCPLPQRGNSTLVKDPSTGKLHTFDDYIEALPNADFSKLEVFEANKCDCNPHWYCLVDDGNTCRRDVNPNNLPWDEVQVSCYYKDTPMRSFHEAVMPILFIWYGILFTFLFCTDYGRNICFFVIQRLKYAVAYLIPDWFTRTKSFLRTDNHLGHMTMEQVRVESRLRDEMRQHLFEQAVQSAAIGRHGMDDGDISLSDIVSGNVQIRLMLKTRRFTKEIIEDISPHGESRIAEQSQQHVKSSDITKCHGQVVPDRTCSICLTDIDEGETVSNLACYHVFHIECLKDWLKRKNSCPLCLHKDLAYPKTKRKRPIA